MANANDMQAVVAALRKHDRLRAGVVGTGIEPLASRFRFRRASGEWSAWQTSTDLGFTLFSADPGDQVTVEVQESDRAGNYSASRTETVTIPAPVAEEAVVAIVAVECALQCPALAAAATVGVVTVGDWVIDNVDWPVIHISAPKWIRVTRTQEASQSFEDYKAEGKRDRNKLGERIENSIDPAYRAKRGKGEHAHHIVEVGRKASEYAQKVLWRCGIDLNDPRNGVFLSPTKHYRTFRKEYREAINDIMKRYDPDKGHNCFLGDGPFQKSLIRALRDIAEELKKGTFLNK